MVVQSDSFRSRVQGIIYGARLVSITTVGEDTYETTLSLDIKLCLICVNFILLQHLPQRWREVNVWVQIKNRVDRK